MERGGIPFLFIYRGAVPAKNERREHHAPGAIAVSAGSLLYKADQEVPEEWRDDRLQDRSRPIITHCALGPLGAISAKTLKDMGFANVSYMEGGIEGWKKAKLPTEPVR